jgi:subtilisin family serine protease
MEKLIVTFRKEHHDSNAIVDRWSSSILSGAKVKRVSRRVVIVETSDPVAHLSILNRQPEVESVEKDTAGHAVDLDDESTAFEPKDPLLRQQWNLGAIGAQSAWEHSIGRGQTIAFVDSGLDGTHPEFGGNGDQRINANLSYSAILAYYEPVMRKIRDGTHPKIAPGYNYVDDNDNTFDFHRHGTAVASIAASLGNGLGMVGVAPEAKIAPYKVLEDDGRGNLSNVIEAIGKIIESNVRIISISLAYSYSSTALQAIVSEARDSGILVIAASGNSNSERRYYPASCDDVICVGGTDSGHRIWSEDQQGSTWPCDIVAPAGPQTVAFKWRGRYTTHKGTSLAAPHVAGVAALCLELYPDMSVDLLKEVLFRSGGRDGTDPKWGYGEVNALKAVELTLQAKETTQTKPNWAALKELQVRIAGDVAALGQLIEKYSKEEP